MLEMFLRKQSGKLLLLLWCWKIPPCESVHVDLHFSIIFWSMISLLDSSLEILCNQQHIVLWQFVFKHPEVGPRMLLFPHLGCCGNSVGLNNHQIYWSFLQADWHGTDIVWNVSNMECKQIYVQKRKARVFSALSLCWHSQYMQGMVE